MRPLTTVVVLVAVLVGTGIWWFFFRGPSSADCAPVREMLSFNKTQIEAMNAKTHVPDPGTHEASTEPSELDYRAWVDGLTDRAAKVTAPDFAGPAKDMAQTAERLVRARLDFDAQNAHTAPGAVPPASAMVVTAFNDQYQSQVTQLLKACPL
ncbi:MAG: hypothetical protein JWR11_2055 [Mycobacterium sp.]|nr:hypothetical protein [Mycobacterium sp.]